MLIKFPTAKSLKNRKVDFPPQKNEVRMEKVVKSFLENKVYDAVKAAYEANRNWVNVEVPMDAYKDLKYFYTLCVNALKPLGYNVEESDDGCGQYNTLYVTWR